MFVYKKLLKKKQTNEQTNKRVDTQTQTNNATVLNQHPNVSFSFLFFFLFKNPLSSKKLRLLLLLKCICFVEKINKPNKYKKKAPDKTDQKLDITHPSLLRSIKICELRSFLYVYILQSVHDYEFGKI